MQRNVFCAQTMHKPGVWFHVLLFVRGQRDAVPTLWQLGRLRRSDWAPATS